MTTNPKDEMPGEIWAAKLQTRGQIWCEYDPSPNNGVKYIRADIVENMRKALLSISKNSSAITARYALAAYEASKK